MPLCDSNELGGYSAQVETKALELEDVKAGIGRVHVTACGHSVTMCNIISIHFTFDIVLGLNDVERLRICFTVMSRGLSKSVASSCTC